MEWSYLALIFIGQKIKDIVRFLMSWRRFNHRPRWLDLLLLCDPSNNMNIQFNPLHILDCKSFSYRLSNYQKSLKLDILKVSTYWDANITIFINLIRFSLKQFFKQLHTFLSIHIFASKNAKHFWKLKFIAVTTLNLHILKIKYSWIQFLAVTSWSSSR